jgi:hypothetical protein
MEPDQIGSATLMSEFKTLDAAADCIEATNAPNVNAYKTVFAACVRRGNIDLPALDNIERDARRQLAACRFIRSTLRDADRELTT